MTNVKERILKIPDLKGVTKDAFFNELGISYGNFKGKAKTKALSSDVLATIVAKHSEINPTWLLTGQGEMLLSEEEKAVSGVGNCKQCEELKKENDLLKQIIEAKNETIKALQSKDSNGSGKRQHSA